MNRRALEELFKKEDKKAPLVINMIVKRVRQLFKGDRAMVEHQQVMDPVDVAIREFLDGRLEVKEEKTEK
jgi:DNA-directed RNA polymerase subunit K/omega